MMYVLNNKETIPKSAHILNNNTNKHAGKNKLKKLNQLMLHKHKNKLPKHKSKLPTITVSRV
jgi:hypothetical protein